MMGAREGFLLVVGVFCLWLAFFIACGLNFCYFVSWCSDWRFFVGGWRFFSVIGLCVAILFIGDNTGGWVCGMMLYICSLLSHLGW